MNKLNNKKESNTKTISLFEIFLMVSLTITTAYFIHESASATNVVLPSVQISKLDKLIAGAMVGIGSIIFGQKGMVSALTDSDLVNGAWTCPVSKNGNICQEYAASDCPNVCAQACIPTTRDKSGVCRLGTCYNRIEGTCTEGAPRAECENKNDTWFDDQFGNVPECMKGCCIIGDNALFVTEQECKWQSSLLGTDEIFKPEINNQLSCYVLSKVQEEGACTFTSEFETTCKFTTRTGCEKLKGTFNLGLVCSAEELKTNCKPQATVGCVEGKDEIYWFDSCGNRENIYDSNNKGLNGGKILAKSESCSLGTSSNPFAYQGTCGNCFYLTGSRCGVKTSSEKLDDPSKNVVCRDLTCTDENGKKRQNGESWCTYQSSIGVDAGSAGLQRSIDTVGSQHFRNVCVDGEVTVEPCADYRNEICTEAREKTDSGIEISSAACRLNRWQECTNYNFDLQNQNNPDGMTPDERDSKCNKNPDCFVKELKIADHFAFNMCVPKYNEGLSTTINTNTASGLCSLASQKCTETWVADEGGDFQCVSNCGCHTPAFAEQLNDLCISLGDCGTKANYLGDLTVNHKIKVEGGSEGGTPYLTQAYLDKLKTYSSYKNSPNKYAAAAKSEDFYGSLGIPDDLGKSMGAPEDPAASMQMMGMISGMAGIGLAMYGSSIAILAVSVPVTTTAATGITTTTMTPMLGAAGGALAGAAIAFAVVSMLLQFTGVGRALGPEISYALMGVAAVAGAIAGAAVASAAAAPGASVGSAIASTATASAGTMGAVVAAVAFWLIIAIIIFIIIEFLLGAGEVKEITYTFSCMQWQAPTGGARCGECGKDGFKCTRYACNSIGQTCEFINEGTGAETCVNINPNDVTSPVISPLEGSLPAGYEYSEVSDSGFKVKSNFSEGCIENYKNINLGIETNEPAQCRMSMNRTDFESMDYFGGSNLFLWNHTLTVSMPNLDSLGLSGVDPTRKADFNLIVKCMDKNGNKNIKDYMINFCVKPGQDISPPIVAGRLPDYEYVSYNATSTNASIYVNEPSDCKYDSENVEYDAMRNVLTCKQGVKDIEYLGWKCTNVWDINDSINKYYISCKDQPWLTPSEDGISPGKIRALIGRYENGTEVYNERDAPATWTRNTMTTNYELVFKRSPNPLTISSIKPDGTISSGTAPATVKISATTAGGVDAKSSCQYAVRADYLVLGGDTFVPPNTVEHEAILQLFAGEHLLYVKCSDLAGNIADGSATFVVNIDTDAPVATRVFKQDDVMNLVTNENSKCYFVTDSSLGCDFNINNATLMSGDQLVHTTDVSKGGTYYIKCKDGNGNPRGDSSGECTMKVRGVDLR